MIRSELRLAVLCNGCTNGLTRDRNRPTGVPAWFVDRRALLAALDAALTSGAWVRMLDGRLFCPGCTARQCCAHLGHDYGDPGGWRMCACDRSIPAHADTPPVPTGGDDDGTDGCGMTWRLCGRCDHIDEHHITKHDERLVDERDVDEHDEHGLVQVQPGGHLRQDVPAGLALPTHTPTHTVTGEPRTCGQQDSGEITMVEPDPRPDPQPDPDVSGRWWAPCGATRQPGSRWVCREEPGHGSERPHRDAMGDRWSPTPAGESR